MREDTFELAAADGHRWRMQARLPEGRPRASLLWSPALGIAARHYLPFAEALAGLGIATFLHEWRGHGSSDLRADHGCDWGYRELLEMDMPVAEAAVEAACPGTPRIIGGHSLGGQVSACRLALSPRSAERLWLVGSGAPFPPSAFGLPIRLGLAVAVRLLPWLARRSGALPGRRLGFGGREAPGVMRDWAGTARARGYRIHSLGRDLDPLLAKVEVPIDGVVLADDTYAPEASMRALSGKLASPLHVTRLDDALLEGRADHFKWMKTPDAVARALAARLPGSVPTMR